jgi:hemolysin activation/secretion protein
MICLPTLLYFGITNNGESRKSCLRLGLIWEPINGLNFRVDYAPPLVNLNIRGNNVWDDGFYFSASYDF